jgi:hypothetical protein
MESNGESNKIHISQMTADLIDQAGKGYVGNVLCRCFFSLKRILLAHRFLCISWYGIVDNRHWLTTRSEEVMAKGKGMMQTYWCDPLSAGTDSDRKERHSSNASSETGSEFFFEI